MTIDIDKLSEEELVELNHKIISRLRLLRQMRSHTQMLNFSIGEKVSFCPSGEPEITGTLTRYNKKSVTVITDKGEHWNVHPGFLRKATAEKPQNPGDEKKLVMFHRLEPGSK